MSATKPIKIYHHGGSPNPWKVVILAEELGIRYELVMVDSSDLKKEPYESKNPNGRVPAVDDPNNNITVWESAAILEYLEETYDVENKFNYTSSPEKFLQSSWKHFQMSGQGPYFGQKAWFSAYHPEKVPSAIERYYKEVLRVIGVIDRYLQKTGTPYLVGEKISYADLMWVPWNTMLPMLLQDSLKEVQEQNPAFFAWQGRLMEREGVKAALAQRAKYMH